MKKYHDMRPSSLQRVKIVDRTHRNGVPTFINMQRQLHKLMQHA